MTLFTVQSYSKTQAQLKGQCICGGNQAGQAVIEYVLLLLVVLMMVLGGLYQFSDAFKKFSGRLFGNYVSCLLETGEMPGQNGECVAPQYNLAEGVPADGAPIGSGGGNGVDGGSGKGDKLKGGGDSTNVATGTARGSRGASADDGDSDKSKGMAGGAGVVPASAGEGGRFNPNRGLSKRVPATQPTGDSAVASGGEGGSKSGGRSPTLGSRQTSALDKQVGRERYITAKEEQNESSSSELRPTKVEATAQDKEAKGARVPASAYKKSKTGEDIDVGMSFPDFMRYLMIAAMVIGVVFFIGLQANSIQKGREKG